MSGRRKRDPIESTPEGAYNAALRILGMRDHSRSELAGKLEQRGFSSPHAQDAVGRLAEMGYLDDAKYAALLVRSKPDLARRGLERLLAQKGVSPDVAEEVLVGLDGEEEYARALRLTRKYNLTWTERGRVDDRSRRRLAGYLGRRGFAPGAAFRALEELESERQ